MKLIYGNISEIIMVNLIKIKPNKRNIEYYIESKLQIELIILFLKSFCNKMQLVKVIRLYEGNSLLDWILEPFNFPKLVLSKVVKRHFHTNKY